ncbi:MAG: Uma2 family endonuclease [Bacteroidota bacterium]
MTVNLAKRPVYYPSSDGKPMAENTIQFEWLTTIKFGLEELTEGKEVFVAGDLLWYPLEGNNRIRVAPDVMAALGRPKGHRSSYLQWREDGIPPQVVIEILSPGNKKDEMAQKLVFYEKYGVKEYIIYYPHKNDLQIYERIDQKLVELETIPPRWTSKYLGFHLKKGLDKLTVLHPDDTPFKTYLEVVAEKRKAIAEKQQAITAKEQAIVEKEQALLAKEQAVEKEQAALAQKDNVLKEKEILAQKLRDLGIDPSELLNKK